MALYKRNKGKMGKNKKRATSAAAAPGAFPAGVRNALIQAAWELGDPLCAAEMIELVHVECQREASGRILRLFIDKPGGVMLDDCSRISRQMSDLLDVHVDAEAEYHLEVSSPGLERPVSKAADFQRFTGRQIEIRMYPKVAGKKKVKGILNGIAETDLVMVITEDGSIEIPRARITRARLIIDGVE